MQNTMPEEEQDAAAMQRAFQDFMLGGTKKESRNTEKNQNEQLAPGTPSTPSARNIKQLYTIIKAFRGTLVRDWLQLDDDLYRVLDSIANLRERTLEINRRIDDLQQADKRYNRDISSTEWKTYGYRMSHASSTADDLQKEDLEFTLSYNLVQHERMLASARHLLLKLGQAQDALGRRIDELWTQSLTLVTESAYQANSSFWEETPRIVMVQVEECQELFTATASELYRKQVLAEQVLDSVYDDLLVASEGSSNLVEEFRERPDSVRCARQCLNQWRRIHKDSHLCGFETLIEKLKLDHGV